MSPKPSALADSSNIVNKPEKPKSQHEKEGLGSKDHQGIPSGPKRPGRDLADIAAEHRKRQDEREAEDQEQTVFHAVPHTLADSIQFSGAIVLPDD